MSDEPKNMAEILNDLAAQDPAIVELLGGRERFEETRQSISKNDTHFQERGGVFFEIGKSPMDTARAFTEIHVEQHRESGRPSLPALVAHHLDDIGLEQDSPHYKAAILVAARAEIDLAVTPEYHNTNHFADVTAHVATLMKHNNNLAAQGVEGAVMMTKEEIADSITAAVGHDLGHPGGKNALPGQAPGEFDYYRLEEQAFQAMLPLMQEAGLPQKSIDEIHTMIQTTSPDGPHGILKDVMRAHHSGNGVNWEEIKGHERFPELKVLADNPRLAERAAILEDADLGGSAFEGLQSNVHMSKVLTEEVQNRGYKNKAGAPEDLNGDFARKMFGQFVVQDGPASLAARDALGPNWDKLMVDTEHLLASVMEDMKPDSKFAAPAKDTPVVSTGTPKQKAPGIGKNSP